MSCPTTDTLEQLALGFLEDPATVREHIRACASCGEAVRALGQDYAALTRAAQQVPVPKVPKPAPAVRRRPAPPWKMLSGVAACLVIAASALLMTQGGTEPNAPPPRAVTTPQPGDTDFITDGSFSMFRQAGLPKAPGQGKEKEERERLLRDLENARIQLEHRTKSGEALAASTLPVTPAPAPAPPANAIREFYYPQAPKKAMPAPVVKKPDPFVGSLFGRTAGKPDATPVPKAEPKPEASKPDEPLFEEAPEGGRFKDHGINPAISTALEKKSTFALDVDTASYAVARGYLLRGALPPRESVRVEEFLNSIRYQDAPPARGSFGIGLEVAPSPFHAKRHLLRVAILAKEVSEEERKSVALTFVIDTSGSMNSPHRITLVKQALTLLVNRLRPADKVGIVVYGSNARKVLDLTSLKEKFRIQAAIDDLHCGGSTNAEAGLRLGYQMAAAKLDAKITSRVILCSDGVANVGRTGPKAILKTIEAEAKKGITLTTLGFGMGSYNDHLMEQLADKGDGNYSYIDSYAQAKKIFTQELTGLLEVVGYDSKVQVEFNPETVATFRLVGYENRHVANKDFRNDAIDAGEIGSGHRVTALYELELKKGKEGRLATVRLRYREPDTKEQVEPMEEISVGQVPARLQDASPSFRLAASVMQFAEILRGSPKAHGATLAAVKEVATPAVREMDDTEDAREFLMLVDRAMKLKR